MVWDGRIKNISAELVNERNEQRMQWAPPSEIAGVLARDAETFWEPLLATYKYKGETGGQKSGFLKLRQANLFRAHGVSGERRVRHTGFGLNERRSF
jgi:hypothetical protein